MRVSVVVLVTLLALAAAPARAEDSVGAARERYIAADYEEALAMLDRLKQRSDVGAVQGTIERYRAYCLLALDRAAAAEEAIAAVIMLDPLYQLSDEDASPRIRNAFRDVRHRVLPSVIQQRYGAAKLAFDEKQYEAAAVGFSELLQVMAVPELAGAIDAPPLADLRTLASGFRELSINKATPPVATQAPPPMPMPPGTDNRIYAVNDARVVPPTPLRQSVPPVSPNVSKGVTRAGVLELIIDATGAVETAIMLVSIGSRIDTIITAAAKRWRYQPARLDGRPVSYRKLLQIDVRQ